MKTKVISCEIFKHLLDEEEYPSYDFVYFEVAKHDHPEQLKERLQLEIDASQQYDLIILLYCLCGNAIVDLVSPNTDMLVFRAHDCSSVLLGNRKEYINHSWSCHALCQCGYIRSSLNKEEEYSQYGEHAQYLQSILSKSKSIHFVRMNKDQDELAIQSLRNKGYQIDTYHDGTNEVILAILQKLNHPMILYLPKGKRIQGIYDFEHIIQAK